MDKAPKPDKSCAYCGRKISFYYHQERNQWFRSSSDLINIDPKGFFCTLRCAAKMGARYAERLENTIRDPGKLGEKP